MTWRAYQVVLRLRSPLHSGWRKVGNLQMTRPYVTGRMIWGALTMRLTRDKAKGPATDSKKYQKKGRQVHESLAFTYFYPSLYVRKGCQIHWPWEDESYFRFRFLSSYAATALSYPHHSAAEGTLHEVEYLSPQTLDDGKPVYLFGYIFEKPGHTLSWRDACRRLQIGGERGYGWGKLALAKEITEVKDGQLFNGQVQFFSGNDRPLVSVDKKGCLLAHTLTKEIKACGPVEPLVGREWRSHDPHGPYAGQYIDFTGVCYTPGSKVLERISFEIGDFGIWQKVE